MPLAARCREFARRIDGWRIAAGCDAAAGRARPDPAGAAELVSRLMLEPAGESGRSGAALQTLTPRRGTLQPHGLSCPLDYAGRRGTGARLARSRDRSAPAVLAAHGLFHARLVKPGALLRTALVATPPRSGGPLILVPALTGLFTWASLMYPALTRYPWLVLAILLLGWLAPPALEHAGVLASTWSIADGVIASRSAALVLDGTRSIVCVFGASIATILVAAYHGTTLSRANLDAQRRLVTQAWHLQQLLPPDARMAAVRD
jgi:hypothetical protein